jgi:hypothetical protein
MTRDIIQKLKEQIEAGITTEVQVVYLLTGVRKLIERDEVEDAAPEEVDVHRWKSEVLTLVPRSSVSSRKQASRAAMANPEHLEILKQGVERWKEWRNNNTDRGKDSAREIRESDFEDRATALFDPLIGPSVLESLQSEQCPARVLHSALLRAGVNSAKLPVRPVDLLFPNCDFPQAMPVPAFRLSR